MEKILSVEQVGLVHLWCRGWPAVVTMSLGCIKWAGIWSIACIVFLILIGGWREPIKRWDAVLYGFSMGVVCRIAVEMAWKKVVIDADGIRVFFSSGHVSRHARAEVRRLCIATIGPSRTIVIIDWLDPSQATVIVCGRTKSVDGALEKLNSYYDAL